MNRKEVIEIKKDIIGIIFILTISLIVNIPNILAQTDNKPNNPDTNLRDDPNNNLDNDDNNLNELPNDNFDNENMEDNDYRTLEDDDLDDDNNENDDLDDTDDLDDLDDDVMDNDLYENLAYGVGGIIVGALATYFLKRER